MKIKSSGVAVLLVTLDLATAFLQSVERRSSCNWKPLLADTSSSTTDGTTSPKVDASNGVDFKAYSNGYKTVYEELPFAECKASSGEIPLDLKGTYFRCGPAMFSAGSIMPPKTSIIQPREGPPVPDGQNPNRMVQHPFDGDGGIVAVTFNGNENKTATARFRYVRTVAFTNERRKGQRLYKAMDSTRQLGPKVGEGLGNDLHTPLFRHHLQPGLNKNRKNTSNTRPIYWGKRLLSLWEGGQPYKMDALALSTEGRSQLGGVLTELDSFGCKMVVDPKKDRAVMYGVEQDAKTSSVTVYEFNNDFTLADEGNGKVKYTVPGFAMLSDMGVTENYAVFIQPPVTASFQMMLIKEPGKVLTVEKAPSTLHLLPRFESKREQKTISIPFDGIIDAETQICNAYEDGDTIVLDLIRADGSNKGPSTKTSKWPWAASQEEYTQNASKKSLWRYVIDMKMGTISKERISDNQCYFGIVNPNYATRKHRYIYVAVGGLGTEIAPPQGISQIDTETKAHDTWMPESYEFCGEPMFAPKEKSSDDNSDNDDDDDGYVLSVLFNGKTEQSEMLVFQSTDISSGPITRIPLGIGIPHGLHGCFTTAEEAMWSAEEIIRRAKLSDKMESRGNLWNEVKSDFSGLGLRFDDMEEYFGDSFLS